MLGILGILGKLGMLGKLGIVGIPTLRLNIDGRYAFEVFGESDGALLGVSNKPVMVRWRCNDGASESLRKGMAGPMGKPVVGSRSGNGSLSNCIGLETRLSAAPCFEDSA